MNYQEIYDELKALQNRAFNLSKDDRKYVRQISKELEVEFVERKNCKSCFADQLIVLSIFVKKFLLPTENINCKYEVIGNKDVSIRGQRINNETITNDLAEWLIKSFKNHEKYIKLK